MPPTMVWSRWPFGILALIAFLHAALCFTIGPYAAVTLGPLIFLFDGVRQVLWHSPEISLEGYAGRMSSWFGWALGVEIAAILLIGTLFILRRRTSSPEKG